MNYVLSFNDAVDVELYKEYAHEVHKTYNEIVELLERTERNQVIS
jgi:hypothetical protein